jgi:hypothetical protein
MKFYYENEDFRNIPNGNGFCEISNLDWEYGFQNNTTELSDEPIIWNFSMRGGFLPHMFDENMNYIKSVFESVKDKPNVKLTFTNFHEGGTPNQFIEKLIQLKNRVGLDNHQICIITNNANVSVYEKMIDVIYKPYLLGFLADHYKDILYTPIQHNNTIIGLLSSDEYINSEKKKFFLSYNKNTTKPFRVQLLLWLMKTGIIDDSYVSILIKNQYFDRNQLRSDKDELYDLIAWFNQFEKKGFNILDWDYPNHQNDVFSSLKYTTKSHYADTLFNIITETTCDTNSLNLTEKSFKGIANCHPYLVIGDINTHKHIKDLGFELYEDLIDYSFDSIDNSEIRLNSALKEVKRIYNIGGNGILEWYKKNIDKIEYNKSKFFEYKFSDMIKETILDLKKQFSSTESYKNII